MILKVAWGTLAGPAIAFGVTRMPILLSQTGIIALQNRHFYELKQAFLQACLEYFLNPLSTNQLHKPSFLSFHRLRETGLRGRFCPVKAGERRGKKRFVNLFRKPFSLFRECVRAFHVAHNILK